MKAHTLPSKFNNVATVCAALFALAVSMPAAAAEPIALCLENADVHPWRTKEGGGLNIELLNMVAKKLDISFSYQGIPWKRCLSQLKANEVSGAIGASFNPERLEIGNYPGGTQPDINKRLNFDRYVLVRRKGSNVSWDGKSFQNLDGAIGIQLGYSIGATLLRMGVKYDEGSQRPIDLARKLNSGRLAAAAMLDGEVKSLLASDPALATRLEVLPTPLVEKAYYMMLSHTFVTAHPELAARIWNAVEEIRNSPAYQKRERDAMDKPMR
jgi:polar amino acid transport system substrate-binding protein